MRYSLRRAVATFLTFVVILALSGGFARADPITFTLVQSGWTGGGQIRGTFTGEDLNHNGVLALESGEILDFVVALTGNTIVSDFTHTLGDLQFFRYTLGTPGFPPSFPLFSDNGTFAYDADDKTIFRSGFQPPFIGIVTSEPASVTAIPEPSTWLLVSSGLAGFLYRRRPCDRAGG